MFSGVIHFLALAVFEEVFAIVFHSFFLLSREHCVGAFPFFAEEISGAEE